MQTILKMKKNAVHFVLVSSLLIFMGSCKKDKKDAPAPPVSAKIQEYRDGDEFIRFNYNADGTVNKATIKSELNTAGTIVDFNISYNGEKKISSISTSAGETIIPVYENNVLKRADNFSGSNRTGYTNYLFENGSVTRATIYQGQGTDFLPILEFNFSYNAAGNVTETVLLVGTDVPGHMVRAGHVESQYDQKTNPLYEHKELLALLWHGVSKNNIVQEDQFDADLSLDDRYFYTYTYKANGLPDHASVKKGLPGQPSTTSDVNFIYK